MADSGSVSRRKEYQEIEKDFRERYGEDTEVNRLFEPLVPQIRNSCLGDDLDKYQYEDRLRKGRDVVNDIRFALTYFLKETPPGVFLPVLGLDAINEQPDKWSSPSPVNVGSLDAATARYLKEPWMQLDRIDWCILNGFIFNEMAHVADAIKSGVAFGTIN